MKNRSHILFIVENNTVPPDIRVWREAKAAKRAGHRVTIIAPANAKYPRRSQVIDGIQIHRHPNVDHGGGAIGQVKEYLNAFLWEAYLSFKIFLKNPFTIIHAANPPDNIFIIAWFYKLFGVKYIFDHHDLSPELYIDKFSGRRDCVYHLLNLLERLSCKTADVVISTNQSFKNQIIRKHHVKPEKIFIVRNDPDIAIAPTEKRDTTRQKNGFFDLVYVGSINNQDGVDIFVHVVDMLVNEFRHDNIKCNVVGDGGELNNIKKLADKLGLSDIISFKGYVYDRILVKQYIDEADICLETAPANEANRRSTFIKIMEYMSAGKALVAFDLDETRYSVGDTAVLVEPGNNYSFAEAVHNLIENPGKRRELGVMAKKRIERELNWQNSSATLYRAYESIT